jgi:MFS family permease
VKLDKRTWIKVIAVDMLMLCFSLNVSLLGQMFTPIKAFYNINLSQGGLLLSMQSIGGLLLSIVCILFISSLNKTKLMVGCGLVLCILLMLVGVLPPLFLLFIMFAVLGFSGGAINTLSNSVMVDTVPQRAERYINFMHMLFSFGSVVAPLVSQAIFPSVGLTGVFLIFGGFALCWAVYAVYAYSHAMKIKLVTGSISFADQFREALRVLKTPGMGVIFLISIFITAWQLSTIYYISSYFTELSGNAMMGALALSLFFLGMMVSRLTYSRVADKFSKGRVLLLTNAVGLLAWIAVFLVPDITLRYAFVVVAAMACGNNFPVTFSAACRLVPTNTAAASGFVNLGYYIAIFAFIPAIGALGDAAGLDKALLFAAVPLLFIIPAALVLHRRMGTPTAASRT